MKFTLNDLFDPNTDEFNDVMNFGTDHLNQTLLDLSDDPRIRAVLDEYAQRLDKHTQASRATFLRENPKAASAPDVIVHVALEEWVNDYAQVVGEEDITLPPKYVFDNAETFREVVQGDYYGDLDFVFYDLDMAERFDHEAAPFTVKLDKESFVAWCKHMGMEIDGDGADEDDED